jgi:hypothetical protein
MVDVANPKIKIVLIKVLYNQEFINYYLLLILKVNPPLVRQNGRM